MAEDIDQQINEANTADVPITAKQDNSPETEREIKLQEIRLKLLEGLIDCLPQLEEVGGLRSIPFLQVPITVVLLFVWVRDCILCTTVSLQQLLHCLTGYLELPKPNKLILYKLLKAIINTLGIKTEVWSSVYALCIGLIKDIASLKIQ